MPVIYDPNRPENKCKVGKHDLPSAENFAYATIYECDRPGCAVQFKRTSGRTGSYWEKYDDPQSLVNVGPFR